MSRPSRARSRSCRQQNLRLAEIADVVQELLVPLSSRDQARVDAAIEKFSQGL